MKVLVETAYPQVAAGSRVRWASFVPHLARHGVAASYAPTLSDADYRVVSSPSAPSGRKALRLARAAARLAGRRTPDHDLRVVHRLRFLVAGPGLDPPPARGAPLAYDFDDNLLVGSGLGANLRFVALKRERRRCVAYLRRADLVIAGNRYLAGAAMEHAARVEVVPSCVDTGHQPVRAHEEADVVTVGWIGSRSTSGYLEPVLPVFERLNREGVRARLVVVGGALGVQAAWLEQRPWDLTREPRDLASFDVGIMPLPDNPWTRGKCGYKILQYFAAGVPAVASPVGVNSELIGDDRGRLASDARAWEAALRELIASASERRRMGAAAREFAAREYSYERWAGELADVLRSAS